MYNYVIMNMCLFIAYDCFSGVITIVGGTFKSSEVNNYYLMWNIISLRVLLFDIILLCHFWRQTYHYYEKVNYDLLS